MTDIVIIRFLIFFLKDLALPFKDLFVNSIIPKTSIQQINIGIIIIFIATLLEWGPGTKVTQVTLRAKHNFAHREWAVHAAAGCSKKVFSFLKRVKMGDVLASVF